MIENAYRRGQIDALQGLHECPYLPGSAEADAYYAGQDSVSIIHACKREEELYKEQG